MSKISSILLAVGCGLCLAFVDSRPTWDDTGISAFAILITCTAFAFVWPGRWWLWAIAVGVWIPAWGILQTQNYGALLALLVAFVGAMIGMSLRYLLGEKQFHRQT